MGLIADLLNKQTKPKEVEVTPTGKVTQLLEQNKPPRIAVQEKVQAGETLSRNDLRSLGFTEKTNAQQRKVITDAMRRKQAQPTTAQLIGTEMESAGFIAEQVKAGTMPEMQRVPQLFTQLPGGFMGQLRRPIPTETTKQQYVNKLRAIRKGPGTEKEKDLAAKAVTRTEISNLAGQVQRAVQAPHDYARFQEETQKLKGKFLAKTYRRWERGSAMVFGGGAHLTEELTRVATLGKYGDTAADYAKMYHDVLKQPEMVPVVETVIDKYLGGAIETAPFLISSLAPAALTGGATLPSLIAGFLSAYAVEGNNAYQAAKDRGKSERAARIIGFSVGIINGAIEVSGGSGGKYFKNKQAAAKAIATRLGKARIITRTILENALQEGIKEELPQGIVSMFLGGDLPLKEDGTVDYKSVASQLVDDTVMGTLLGGIVSAPITGTQVYKMGKVAEISPEQVAQIEKLERSIEEGVKAAPTKAIAAPSKAVEPIKEAEVTEAPAERVSMPKKGTVAEKEARIAAKERQPVPATKMQVEAGLQFGLSEQDVTNRLHKAQLRYEELRSKPIEDLTSGQKKELDFLSRKRVDIQALLGRDLKPLSREAVERRAAQYEIPFQGRTTKAILKDIVVRAEETRQPREVTGWPEWRKGEPVNVTPDKLLKYSLQHEARGAKKGYYAGQVDLTISHKNLLEHAEKNLPAGEYQLVVRAARQAVKARTPGEMQKVVKAVNRMVENYAKASAIQDFKTISSEAKKAKLRPEFQAKVDDIMEEFKLSEPREKTLKRFESLLKAADLDEIGEIPQRLIDRAREVLSNIDKPLLRDFEADEIRAISAAIGKIINENVHKNKFYAAKTERTKEEIIGKVKVDLEEVDRKIEKGERLTANEFIAKVWGTKHEVSPIEGKETWLDENTARTLNWIKLVAAHGQLSYDTIVGILGGTDSSMYKILYENLQETANKELDIKYDFKNFMIKAGVNEDTIENGGNLKKGVAINLPEARDENGARVPTIKMTMGELLDFAKLVTDPDNREALLRDQMEGIRLGRQGKKGHSIKIHAADMKAILDIVPKEIKDHLNAWHEYTNGRTTTKYNIKDEVGREWLKEHGYPMPQKENWSTRERYLEAIETKKHDPMRQFYESYLEDMGIFKTRKRSNAPFVLRNGYARMVSQVSNMAAYASKATTMNDAYSILYDRGFRETVSKSFKNGELLLKFMEDSLIKFQGREYIAQGTISSLVESLAPRMHVGALIAKPYIMFYQPMSLINALNEIDGKYLLKPLHLRPSKVRNMRKQLNETSPSLRARDEASGAQIMNPVQAENALMSFFGFEKKRLKGIHRTDSWTISIIGLGAEAEGKAKGLTGEALREYTARRTEEITYRTQPTWDPLTISQLAREGRDSALAHQVVMFSSQRSKNTNTAVRETAEYMQKKRLGKKASKAKVVKAFTLSQVAQSMAIWGLRALYFAALGKAVEKIFKLKRKEPEKDWRYYVFGVTGQMLGNWVVVGDILDLALRGITGVDEPGKRERGTIFAETLYQTYETLRYLSKGTSELIKEEEYKTGPKKGELKAYYTYSAVLEKALMAAGPITGLPTQSIAIHLKPFLPHRQEPESKYKETK